MSNDLTHKIDIKDTEFFKYVQSHNASLLILRSLLFLDQCHDFLENQDRNKWAPGLTKRKDQRGDVHKYLLEHFKKDVEYIIKEWPLKDVANRSNKESQVIHLVQILLPSRVPEDDNVMDTSFGQKRSRAELQKLAPGPGGWLLTAEGKKRPRGAPDRLQTAQEKEAADIQAAPKKPRAQNAAKKTTQQARKTQKTNQKSDDPIAISEDQMNVEELKNVNTRDKIIRIASQFQKVAGITHYDPAKLSWKLQTAYELTGKEVASRDAPNFNMFNYASILPTLLDPDKQNNKFLVGVDAEKSFSHFCAMAVSLYNDVDISRGGDIKIFKSPATEYDAAGNSSFIDYMKRIVSIKTNKNDVGTIPGSKFNPYTLILTAKNIEVIKLRYYTPPPIATQIRQNGAREPVPDVPPFALSVEKFFNRSPPVPTWKPAVEKLKKYSMAYLTTNYNPSDNIFLYKTMGDLGQILSFCATYNDNRYNFKEANYNPIFSSFDHLSAVISSMFNKSTILETTSVNAKNNLLIFKRFGFDSASLIPIMNYLPTSVARPVIRAQAKADDFMQYSKSALEKIEQIDRYRQENDPEYYNMPFGKKSNKISMTSTNDLKIKLKSVGINVTKVTRSGKRLPLTRKELEAKAKMFKNLQLRAKKMNVRLMFKSKRRGYVYKSYTRLTNDIQRKGKMKVGRPSRKNESRFG